MEKKKTIFADACILIPKVFSDQRGFFMESFSQKKLQQAAITTEWVQDNHSLSRQAGVLRGLHFQLPPYTQAKLIRVIRGKIYDVIVDLRANSPTFGQWAGFFLDAVEKHQLYVPRGFAHGFCTVEPDTEVLYKTDQYYHPQSDSGIYYNDETLGIDWPVKEPVLSEKDKHLEPFSSFKTPF